jgi:hypothetical protein
MLIPAVVCSQSCSLADSSLLGAFRFQKRGVCISIAGLFRQQIKSRDLPIRRKGFDSHGGIIFRAA